MRYAPRKMGTRAPKRESGNGPRRIAEWTGSFPLYYAIEEDGGISCRAHADVALPFADRAVLHTASRIPLGMKIHNTLSRELLRRRAPTFLRHALAATIVQAGAPIPLQEASRLVRSIAGRAHGTAHRMTCGVIPRPRLGWVDFEFLREGTLLRTIIEDLRADFWDRTEMHKRLDRAAQGASDESMHPLFDQFGKLYTVDLLLR